MLSENMRKRYCIMYFRIMTVHKTCSAHYNTTCFVLTCFSRNLSYFLGV